MRWLLVVLGAGLLGGCVEAETVAVEPDAMVPDAGPDLFRSERYVFGTGGPFCFSEVPTCRRGVNFVARTPGEPCEGAPTVSVRLDGRVIAPDEFTVVVRSGCDGEAEVAYLMGEPDQQVQLDYVVAE